MEETLSDLENAIKLALPDNTYILNMLMRHRKEIERHNQKVFPSYDENLDLEIMARMDIKTLQSACRSNKYLANLCNRETLWKERLERTWDVDLSNYETEDGYKAMYSRLYKAGGEPSTLSKVHSDDLIKVIVEHEYAPIIQANAYIIINKYNWYMYKSYCGFGNYWRYLIASIMSQNSDAIDLMVNVLDNLSDISKKLVSEAQRASRPASKDFGEFIGDYGTCDTMASIYNILLNNDAVYVNKLIYNIIQSCLNYDNIIFVSCLLNHAVEKRHDTIYNRIFNSLIKLKNHHKSDKEILNHITNIVVEAILLSGDEATRELILTILSKYNILYKKVLAIVNERMPK